MNPYRESVNVWRYRGSEKIFPPPLRSRMTRYISRGESNICEVCNWKMANHATIYSPCSGAILVCPGSRIVLRADASVEVVRERPFVKRFKRSKA